LGFDLSNLGLSLFTFSALALASQRTTEHR